MRVLQINSVCGIGSTGRIAGSIDGVLKELGHESFVAYGRHASEDCNTAIKIGSIFDTCRHVLKTRISDRHGYGSLKATIEFIDKVKSLDPDIIHLHNIHGYYINIEVLFRYLHIVEKPVVWTLHDCWPFTGHCCYFDYIGCNKWKEGCDRCPQKRIYPSSLFADNAKENFAKKKELFTGLKKMTIVTPSEWLASLARQSFLKEYRIRVINNGIDLDVFRPVQSRFRAEHGLEDKFLILGVASHWENRKGYEYFMRLSKNLQADESIVLVGLTSRQVSKLPDNITGIVRTNSANELAEIYAAADVFVNPTLEDNFPTTNLEALACGTPVITFNTGGSVESVDVNCGFVVEKGDLNGLLSSIAALRIANQHNYSTKAVERAIALYDRKDRFHEYVDLYNESTRDF